MYGLVLAGGKSSRMGQDKSLIAYHQGQPQREYIFELLSEVCDKVYVSCNARQQVPVHLNPLVDKFEMDSPLNGILTALSMHPETAWLVVAVDMPMINRDTIRHLVSKRNPSRVATCFWDSDHAHPEPLFSIWEPKAYPLALAFHQKGNKAPRMFLKSVDIEMLDPVSPTMHVNINTPDDARSFNNGATDRKE
jgi:molybdenum cofactor guanylyltransferase